MDTSPIRVLLVDDDEDDYIITRDLFSEIEGDGFELEWVATYDAALEAMVRNQHDVYLVDYLLGERNGLELLRETIRNGCTGPMIFLTGTGTREVDIAAMKAGAMDYLVKDEIGAALLERSIRYAIERKRTEQALQESEKKYRTLTESSLTGVFIQQDGKYVFHNDRFAEIHGYTPEELLGMDYRTLIHPDERETVEQITSKRLGGETVPQRYEVRRLRKDGKSIWCEMMATRIEYMGRPAIMGNIIDITERKQAEKALRESEEKYRNLIERASDGIAIIEDMIIKYVNPRLTEMGGYAAEEVIGTSFTDYIPADELPKVVDHYKRRMAGEDIAPTYETVFNRKDGSKANIEVNAGIITYQGKPADFVIIRDITERKRLEEQLLQAQKMEAVGRLAGGIAHDFNNLLTAIMGYSQLLLRRLGEENPLCGDVEAIREAGQRATSLTSQLLAFSRRQTLQPEVLNLNALVSRTEKMLRRLIGEDIKLVTVLAPELRRVKGDPGQIEQTIMNLAVNARDAMPEGGKLTIKTENVTLDEEDCKITPEARPGEFVCLSVSDTGLGMNKEIMQHIFEPFFTTKGPAEGTGLGLSVVYGIVKQHEGWIKVHSEPGQGTTFKLYLPVISGESEDEIEEAIPLQELQGRGERILLVEDEEGVRNLDARVLCENGYVVFDATSAEEALDIFEKEKGNFHLVFSDVVLPGKTGVQLVEQLLSCKPDLRVLLSSGYTDDKSQWSIISERGFRFLQKPYAVPKLLRAMREAIEASQMEPERQQAFA